MDAANEHVVGFYTKFAFRRVTAASLRMFLPSASLETGARIPRVE